MYFHSKNKTSRQGGLYRYVLGVFLIIVFVSQNTQENRNLLD